MPDPPVSRRDLAKLMILGTGAAGLGGESCDAAEEKLVGQKEKAELSTVDLTLDLILARYPSDHLTDEQIERIRRKLRYRESQSAILRQHANDTDPSGVTFAAYRREESINADSE